MNAILLAFLLLFQTNVFAQAHDFRISDNDGDVLNINADGTIPIEGGVDLTAVDSSIYPATDNTYDLGSAAKSWKDIYADGVIYSPTDEAGLELSQSKFFYDTDVAGGQAYFVMQPTASNKELRLGLMPKGTPVQDPDTLIAGIKIFATDYLADKVNNSDMGFYMTSTDGRWNQKKNGTGVLHDFLLTSMDTIKLWKMKTADGSIRHYFANTHYSVPAADNLTSYIASSEVTAGDSIILGAGTYTITADIDIGKAVNIKGQGIDKTFITSSTNTLNVFDVSVDNVRISDLSINITSGGATNRGIYFLCSTGSVCNNNNVYNVKITMSGAGSQTCINYGDSGGTVSELQCSATSTNGIARGVYQVNLSSAEAVTTVNVFGSKINTSSGATYSRAFYVDDSSATNDAILNVYDSYGTSIEGGASTSQAAAANAGDAILNIYGGAFSATDNDVADISSGGVTLYGATLVNGTRTGTISYGGTVVGDTILVDNAIYSTSTGSIGWTTVNAANQACNTTCNNGCVFGLDTAALGNILDCSAATADTCLCAGPN